MCTRTHGPTTAAGALQEVSSVALSATDSNAAFAATDEAISVFDIRKPEEAVATIAVNEDDINQV